MNEETICSEMISFIEEKERLLQQERLATDSHAKNDIVKAILNELDKKVGNENTKS